MANWSDIGKAAAYLTAPGMGVGVSVISKMVEDKKDDVKVKGAATNAAKAGAGVVKPKPRQVLDEGAALQGALIGTTASCIAGHGLFCATYGGLIGVLMNGVKTE